MALPSSGEIHYNEINIELGNSSGTECTARGMETQRLPTAGVSPDSISEWYSYSHISPPSKPTKCNTLEDGTGVYASWFDTSSNEDGFEVWFKVESGGTWTLDGTVGAGVTKRYLTVYSCNIGDNVYTRVKSYNSAGDLGFCTDTTPLTTTLCL